MLSQQTMEIVKTVAGHLLAADAAWDRMTQGERRAVMRALAEVPNGDALYQACNPRDWDVAGAGLALVVVREEDMHPVAADMSEE